MSTAPRTPSDARPSAKERSSGVQRRDLVSALLGVASVGAVASILEACASESAAAQTPSSDLGRALEAACSNPESVYYFASISSMVSQTGICGPGALAIVSGYATPGDGGGGVFFLSSSGTADGGTVFQSTGSSGYWNRIYGGPLNVRWFGATGTTNDTAGLQAALSAAVATGGEIFVPPGTYTTDALTPASNLKIAGAGRGASVLKSRLGDHLFSFTASAYLNYCEISHVTLQGNGGSGHGINIAPGSAYPCQGVYIHDISVTGCGGKGIYMPLEFSSALERVHVDACGDNAIEVEGGSGTTLNSCYVHNVAAGKAGYRIYGGPTLIACNGIDSGDTWGVFGMSSRLGDPQDYVAHVTMIGCNIEDFSQSGYGIRVRQGDVSFFGENSFLSSNAPGSNYVAILFESAVTQPGYLPAQTLFSSNGSGTYKNGYPIHVAQYSDAAPFFNFGAGVVGGSLSGFWDDYAGAAWATPTLTMAQSPLGALAFDLVVSRAQLPSVNALGFGTLQSVAPSSGSYSVGTVMMADGVGWNPLGRAAGKPYLVFWDSSAWKGVSEP